MTLQPTSFSISSARPFSRGSEIIVILFLERYDFLCCRRWKNAFKNLLLIWCFSKTFQRRCFHNGFTERNHRISNFDVNFGKHLQQVNFVVIMRNNTREAKEMLSSLKKGKGNKSWEQNVPFACHAWRCPYIVHRYQAEHALQILRLALLATDMTY